MRQGDVVWEPPADVLERTRVGSFLRWLAEHRDLHLTTHDELWRWSVTDLEGFWSAVWEFFGVTSSAPYTRVLEERRMPGARWFPGVLLNYAEHALGRAEDDSRLAVLGRSQTRPDVDLTFGELRDQVARARNVLLDLGVRRGDRVAGYLPNIPEALVAFLATASIGAIWSSCATEFGARSVVDRFSQLEPAVLLVAGGYRYGDKDVDRAPQVAQIRAGLPSVRHVVDVRYGPWVVEDALSWPDLLAAAPGEGPAFEPVPFDHPLFVLFSSGTTGQPKAIVHGHGGILLEHLKNHAFSWDMGPDDRMLWFTTTAWMMWNALVSSLLVRSSIVMVDGNPLHPDLSWQWRLAEQTRATIMGASPGFVMACRQAGLDLRRDHDLAVRIVGSAGSPMPPEGYAWIADQLGPGVQLNVGSGGTDVCTGIVQNNPLLPVRAGEISGRALAVDAHAFDESGAEVVGSSGNSSSRRRCRPCRWGSGATPTGAGCGGRTSTAIPASGGTGTGSSSTTTASATWPAGRTRPSTAGACDWGPRSSTGSSRSWTQSPTASSSTSRTPRGATGNCCCSSPSRPVSSWTTISGGPSRPCCAPSCRHGTFPTTSWSCP